MFYITPNKNTCFDLDEVLKFNYAINEDREIDEKSLIIDFKTGHSIKLICKDKSIAKQIFEDLCNYLVIKEKKNKK